MKKVLGLLSLFTVISSSAIADQTYDFVLGLAKANADRSGTLQNSTEKCFTSYQDLEQRDIHAYFSTSASLGGGTFRSNILLFQGDELYQESILDMKSSTFSYSNSDGYRTVITFDDKTSKISSYEWFYKGTSVLVCKLAE